MVKLVNLFYFSLSRQMDSLISFVNRFITRKEEMISLQAIDFWTTLSEIEDDLGEGSYVVKNVGVVLPLLLEKLKKPEDYDDEEWSPHKASCTCLQSISLCVKGELLEMEDLRRLMRRGILPGGASKNRSDMDTAIIALG
jgi:hypothetical protein